MALFPATSFGAEDKKLEQKHNYLVTLINQWADSGVRTLYQGFGNLCGSGTGGVTFTGYGHVVCHKTGNKYTFTGELLVTTLAGGVGTDYLTGIKISSVKTALGINKTLIWGGDAQSFLRIVKSTGALYAQPDAQYGYGMALQIQNGGEYLIAARYYNTSGAIGGWPSNNVVYSVNNVWQFQFEMYE